MSERLAFVQACLDRAETIVAVCDRFGISEKTGHKWLARFRAGGELALEDRSHAPLHHRHRLTAATADAILRLRRQHPEYGPVKLRDWLVQHEPERHWPAPSTIGELLQRMQLIRRRRRRPASARQLETLHTVAQAPNTVWTADFKGEFRLGSGRWCYPLTVLDLYSHYLLRCRALPSTATRGARDVFARLFAEYGLPDVIRTDNGVPFAQPTALGRLSALSLWWVRLGIRPEHIRPGRPSENGAHERFHKTLKATLRPAPSLRVQQHRFERFRTDYNQERPHASLPHHLPPAAAYHASRREFPRRLPPVQYPPTARLRLICAHGCFKWHGQSVFVSSLFAGEHVGVLETASDLFAVTYGPLVLGEFDPHLAQFRASIRWVTDFTPEAYCPSPKAPR